MTNDVDKVTNKKDLKSIIKETIESILPPVTDDISVFKEEMWEDLANLYYKYDDEDQKKAFREVMVEISSKIENGKWDQVYKKLYLRGKKERSM